jgi:hypothetical protein
VKAPPPPHPPPPHGREVDDEVTVPLPVAKVESARSTVFDPQVGQAAWPASISANVMISSKRASQARQVNSKMGNSTSCCVAFIGARGRVLDLLGGVHDLAHIHASARLDAQPRQNEAHDHEIGNDDDQYL